MGRAGARGSLGGASAQAAAEQGFEPLSEDEVSFVWKSLVDQGALSEASLQRFMLEVCGDKISAVQARDLLNYMDADGNGSVGKEDFRNFVSVGRLADTDAKAFMWHPNAKYRQEHGTELQEKAGQPEAQPGSAPPPPGGGLHQTLPARGTVAQATQEEEDASVFAQSAPAALLVPRATKSRPASPSGTARGASGARGKSPTSSKTSPARLGSRAKSPATRRGSKERLLSPTESGAGGTQTDPVKAQPKPKPKIKPIGPDGLKRINDCLEKYEAKSWQEFLQEEEQFKLDLFRRFASSDDATELTAGEYHRMLRDWHEMASWSMPCTVRPQDSVAALQHMLERDRATAPTCQRDAQAQAAHAQEASDGGGASEDEVRLPLRVWVDLVDGKFRPQV
mmetsp:Transcript_16942/g.45026  ORF Transcript_16942/g.45026 Transcript_16942/m.45026 type:complete len:395 (+) Transcript_16942:184-1368(+)